MPPLKKKTRDNEIRRVVGRHGFGAKNDDVETPARMYDEWNKEFGFTFDPCPFKHDIEEWDGLKRDWGEVNFVNPPFSDIKSWAKKGIEELKKGKKSVFLIPARFKSNYFFDDIARYASEIRLLRKFAFVGHTKPPPCSCMLVTFDPAYERWRNEETGSFVIVQRIK